MQSAQALILRATRCVPDDQSAKGPETTYDQGSPLLALRPQAGLSPDAAVPLALPLPRLQGDEREPCLGPETTYDQGSPLLALRPYAGLSPDAAVPLVLHPLQGGEREPCVAAGPCLKSP